MRYASEDKTCQEERNRTVLISLSLRIKYKVYALNYPAPYLRSTLPFSPLQRIKKVRLSLIPLNLLL